MYPSLFVTGFLLICSVVGEGNARNVNLEVQVYFLKEKEDIPSENGK
jgi:hypothetical protein